MANDLGKILGENANLSESLQKQINEAWNTKLKEARSELREEYARKYEHDKSVLAETMDKFLTDKLSVELEEFAEDRAKLVQERVAYRRKMKEHAKMVEKFIVEQVSKEIKEFHSDKQKMAENFKKLENFTLKQLSEEIREFRSDKRKLVEQKVRMVSEGKKQLQSTKEKFIARASKLVEANIDKTLKREISQFKEDIQSARENEFGRRIFESFASEFLTSYLNEGTEISKLQKAVKAKEQEINQLSESIAQGNEKSKLLESKLSAAKDRQQRAQVMGKLLKPLSNEKRVVMKDLLESVATKNLDAAFDKYLPAVLNESVSAGKRESGKRVLAESKTSEKTGNRAKQALNENANTDDSYLADIIKLAGINK